MLETLDKHQSKNLQPTRTSTMLRDYQTKKHQNEQSPVSKPSDPDDQQKKWTNDDEY